MVREATTTEVEEAFLYQINCERWQLLKTLGAVFAPGAERATLQVTHDAEGKVVAGITFAPENFEARVYSDEEVEEFNQRIHEFFPNLPAPDSSSELHKTFASFFEEFTVLELGGHAFDLRHAVEGKPLYYKETNAYLENGGVHCPACGSTEIESLDATFDDGIARCRCHCNICPAWWTDTYCLSDVALDENDG